MGHKALRWNPQSPLLLAQTNGAFREDPPRYLGKRSGGYSSEPRAHHTQDSELDRFGDILKQEGAPAGSNFDSSA